VWCLFLQAEGGVDVILEMRADVNYESDLELAKTHGRIVVGDMCISLFTAPHNLYVNYCVLLLSWYERKFYNETFI